MVELVSCVRMGRQFVWNYIFVLDIQDTTEDNFQHTKDSFMGLQNMQLSISM
jgi:hypothetical protein